MSDVLLGEVVTSWPRLDLAQRQDVVDMVRSWTGGPAARFGHQSGQGIPEKEGGAS